MFMKKQNILHLNAVISVLEHRAVYIKLQLDSAFFNRMSQNQTKENTLLTTKDRESPMSQWKLDKNTRDLYKAREKSVWTTHEWLWIYFWLDDKMVQDF